DLTSRLITFAVGSDPIKKVTHIPRLIRKSAEVIFSNSDVKCEFYFSGNLRPIKIDEDQIAQVISHQFVNSCEALRGEGQVQVRVENAVVPSDNALPLPAGNYVKISVKDRGIGIPEADLPKLFDPYFTTKEMGYRRGVGLGLAISYSIVKKHGGYITVESRKEIGTTFSIYLPAHGSNP
ncbi:MAG: ATP-binding protein, partial [Nitrospirota bacterium]|nr:ATP-binding protein [Nitrospirota bacterium]